MARTHTFKGSASAGYGYFAYIEEGQLVIGEDWGREGGILYRGQYRDAGEYLARLHENAPKLYKSITQYYTAGAYDETGKFALISEKSPAEETITKQFKDSRDSHGYGYFGYIERDQLVLCHEAPREGGVYFRGTYEDAVTHKYMEELRMHDYVLYSDITEYYSNQPKSDKHNVGHTDLLKVRIKTTDGCTYDCLVKGTTEIDVTDLFTPKNNKHFIVVRTCTNQRVAININKVAAIEFLEG